MILNDNNEMNYIKTENLLPFSNNTFERPISNYNLRVLMRTVEVSESKTLINSSINQSRLEPDVFLKLLAKTKMPLLRAIFNGL